MYVSLMSLALVTQGHFEVTQDGSAVRNPL